MDVGHTQQYKYIHTPRSLLTHMNSLLNITLALNKSLLLTRQINFSISATKIAKVMSGVIYYID